MKLFKYVLLLSLPLAITACSPEVGSKEWCKDMKAKKSGEMTGNEMKDYTKHCVFKIKD